MNLRIDKGKLQERMQERKLSKTALARIIGKNRDTIARWIAEPEKVQLGYIQKLANLLCSNEAEFLEIFFSIKKQ